MNLPTELMEMTEQTVTTEELAQRLETYENGYREAVEQGSKDMMEYYREKIDALKAAKEATGNEISFGGMYAGLTTDQWRQKAKEELVANGETRDYKRYCENAAKAANG